VPPDRDENPVRVFATLSSQNYGKLDM